MRHVCVGRGSYDERDAFRSVLMGRFSLMFILSTYPQVLSLHFPSFRKKSLLHRVETLPVIIDSTTIPLSLQWILSYCLIYHGIHPYHFLEFLPGDDSRHRRYYP
ncbi:hypothetical protein OF83DRAFT_844217 [Amylostereum chailletii]|nr:hypothetical protein OF83DRAFT_844217 [Amylostereum chailletii]